MTFRANRAVASSCIQRAELGLSDVFGELEELVALGLRARHSAGRGHISFPCSTVCQYPSLSPSAPSAIPGLLMHLTSNLHFSLGRLFQVWGPLHSSTDLACNIPDCPSRE